MAKTLVLLRPREDVKQFAKAAADKFKSMQGIELFIWPVRSLNEAANEIEAGAVVIIFAEELLQITEVNLLKSCYARTKKRKPFIITIEDNFESLTNSISKELVGHTSTEFTQAFIFNSVRNLLTPAGKKLDIRYVQGIVLSVIDVIKMNTQCVILPKPILEARAKETPEDIASVLAFCGDGFLGSLSVKTNKGLMTVFAQKMLYCEESDVNAEMLIDLLAELSNQIAGAVRNGLSEFGYRLSTSMQAVVFGDQFLNASTSNGRYYIIPFLYEDFKFDITLCYNTYQTSIRELEEEMSSAKHGVLDIRLLHAAVDSTMKMLAVNTQVTLEKAGLTNQKGNIYAGNAVQVFHASSWQGKVILALDVPRNAIEYILKNTMGIEPDALDDSTINDYFGEILNQIAGDFLKVVKKYGYSFQRVYQGMFSGNELSYSLKNSGLYTRQKLRCEHFEMDLIFGTDSSFASEFYNVWPYFLKSANFS